jgi:response regulator of citrate/malate metabolism
MTEAPFTTAERSGLRILIGVASHVLMNSSSNDEQTLQEAAKAGLMAYLTLNAHVERFGLEEEFEIPEA